MQAEDDDTLYVSQWVLDSLRVKEGDPLCLIFDLNFSKSISEVGQCVSKASSITLFYQEGTVTET